ncbi:MAG: low molecular weight phosphotyrosine protein phosphatase [Cytophagaceae bacterium]|nr:low molecular weight phosphotyrosine protein phosphatase [Cytophagaceae bacterium]
MVNVLFVCLGNICRSPIAEATFRQMVDERGLTDHIQCDSAGTHNYHIGDLPDARTRRNAELHDLILTHRCRRLTGSDFSKFDHIIGMDESNIQNIRAIAYKATGQYPSDEQVFLLRKFDPDSATFESIPDVPDPYYEEDAFFEKVYQIVRRCNEYLLNFLVKRYSLAPVPQGAHRTNQPV